MTNLGRHTIYLVLMFNASVLICWYMSSVAYLDLRVEQLDKTWLAQLMTLAWKRYRGGRGRNVPRILVQRT